MVDSSNNIDPVSPADPSAPRSGFTGFVASRNGKIIIGAVAFVVVLAVIGGILIVFVFGGAASQLLNQGAQPAAPAKTTTASKPATNAASAAPISNPPEKPVSSTFTFRNVFAPTVKAVTPAPPSSSSGSTSTSTSTGGSSSGSSSSTESNTLLLQSISTVDGEKQATFLWNGQLFTVGEGEQVDSSPWKVVSISSDSVLMLFGDTQLTLTLGQGITK